LFSSNFEDEYYPVTRLFKNVVWRQCHSQTHSSFCFMHYIRRCSQQLRGAYMYEKTLRHDKCFCPSQPTTFIGRPTLYESVRKLAFFTVKSFRQHASDRRPIIKHASVITDLFCQSASTGNLDGIQVTQNALTRAVCQAPWSCSVTHLYDHFTTFYSNHTLQWSVTVKRYNFKIRLSRKKSGFGPVPSC